MIRPVMVIVAKDLRRAIRSGFFVVMGIVTPLALAVVFNLVFANTNEGRLNIAVGYLDAQNSPRGQALGGLLAELDQIDLLDVEVLAPGTDPARAIDESSLRVVIVTPPEFADPAGGGEIMVIGHPDAPVSVGVVRAVLSGFTQGLATEQLTAMAAGELGLGFEVGGNGGGVRLVDVDAETQIDPGARLSAAMVAMFMLFVALLGVTGLLEERDQGTLARILAAPVPPTAVVVAKIMVSVILGVASALAIVAATTVGIGASWGPLPGVIALIMGFSLAATGITVLVTGTARTANGATNIQSTAAVLLTVLGGGFIPLPADGVLAVLSRFTPHYWFLHGLEAIAPGNTGDAAGSILMLLIIAVVLGGPGIVLTQRKVAT